MIRVLVTSDPNYKGYESWVLFRETLTNYLSKVQFEHECSINDIKIISNISMAVAWARKNNVPCVPFKENWNDVDRVIAFDSGSPKMKERIEKAKSLGLLVDVTFITLDKQ